MDDSTPAYCVYINTLLKGPIPAVRDENDLPIVFATQHEAERKIAGKLITRLREFLDGHRDFEAAMMVEEYIAEVAVFPDGSITDADGNVFGSRHGSNATAGEG